MPYYKPPVTYNYVIVDKQVYDTQKEQAKDDENFFSVANRQNAFRAIIKCGVSGNPKGRFVEIKSRKEWYLVVIKPKEIYITILVAKAHWKWSSLISI